MPRTSGSPRRPLNGVNVAIFAYGDNTGTHVVEFNTSSFASATGSISGNTLTISGRSRARLRLVTFITGTGIAANTTITALGTGTGGDGTYTLSGASQTVLSEPIDLGGAQIASFVDPSATTFDQLTVLGDGRISLTYDNTLDASGTTQYVTNVYDLRTPGQTVNDFEFIYRHDFGHDADG